MHMRFFPPSSSLRKVSSVKHGKGSISGSRITSGGVGGESGKRKGERGGVIRERQHQALVASAAGFGVVVTWMPEVVGLNTFSLPR